MITIRRLCALLLSAALVVGLVAPAGAHDPIFLSNDQTTPDTGPFMPDGTISWAVYGTFPTAGETRGFEFDLRDGDELYLSLLIPNLEPELLLPVDELPWMEVTFPDGSVERVEPVIGEVFDEEFSRTSYVTLFEDRRPAAGGRHQIVVHSRAPSRFTVAVGEQEVFGTPADRTVDRPAGFTEFAAPLNAWYTTAPSGEVQGEVAAVDVDIEAAQAALDDIAAAEAAEEPAAATADDSDDAEIDAAVDEEVDPAIDEEVEPAIEPVVDEEPETEVLGARETATEAAGDDSDGGAGWVIPLAVLVAIGGGLFVVIRQRAA